ncbi:MAG TPA: translation elongation factor Ts, partial [Gammaproteobacteria bacterium]|nr:translation elongation factor Ts [Gammaproteobacteria bacterium]
MQITAALVKELRERTGAGMMECKKSLVEANGDIEAAIEVMRKSGLAKASKKAGRTAAEGRVLIQPSGDGKTAVMVEVNCETDFVAKGDDFAAFAEQVAGLILDKRPADTGALAGLTYPGGDQDVETARKELVARIGENISIRRFTLMSAGADGLLGSYTHGSRIGVLVGLTGGNADLAKDLAMHIAASRPVAVDAGGVPAELLEKEKEIYGAQAAESGKPPEIVEKMVQGRVRKYLAEVTLVGQPFVKDPDVTVEKILKDAGATVTGFERYEVGEGIEKETVDFA